MCKSTVFASEVYNTDARGNFLDADFMRHSRDNQTRLSERNAFLSPGGDVQYSHSHDRVAIRYRNIPFSPVELSIVSPTCSLFSLVLYTVLPPTSTLPGYTPSNGRYGRIHAPCFCDESLYNSQLLPSSFPPVPIRLRSQDCRGRWEQ